MRTSASLLPPSCISLLENATRGQQTGCTESQLPTNPKARLDLLIGDQLPALATLEAPRGFRIHQTAVEEVIQRELLNERHLFEHRLRLILGLGRPKSSILKFFGWTALIRTPLVFRASKIICVGVRFPVQD